MMMIELVYLDMTTSVKTLEPVLLHCKLSATRGQAMAGSQSCSESCTAVVTQGTTTLTTRFMVLIVMDELSVISRKQSIKYRIYYNPLEAQTLQTDWCSQHMFHYMFVIPLLYAECSAFLCYLFVGCLH